MDVAASNMTSFNCGKVKVETESMDVINKVIYLQYKDDLFPVRVMEEQIVSGAKQARKHE